MVPFSGCKLVFALLLTALTSITSRADTFKTLIIFDGTDGATPVDTPLVQGVDGNLYGTTLGGGANGAGTVFKMTPAGTVTTLYSFCSLANCADGAEPYGGIVLASDGNFYGTTSQGGATDGISGTVFKITRSGKLTTLHSFAGTDGAHPSAPLIQAANGELYGMTASTFFKITMRGTLTTLSGNFGSFNNGPLVQATDGDFYGTSESGGANGYGMIFKLTPSGSVSTLFSFDSTDGSAPACGLLQASDGDLYGTTYQGGSNNSCEHGCGTVFKITLAGALTTLHNFDFTDGSNPIAALIQATDHNFYGTTYGGGTAGGWGTVFKITPAGKVTTLHSFAGTDGAQPYGPVSQDTSGNLYGTATNGTGIAPDGTAFLVSTGLKPFVTLMPTSGKVGTKVGIMGQGFDSASVVKFGGVQATSVTLTGTTYVTATVPAGAVDGKVTVTTGSTTLTSTKTFIVHDSWSKGAVMPTAVKSAAAGMANSQIYVVGGVNSAATVVGNNQIYNPVTNTWSTGAVLPVTTYAAASAVVGNILYVISGTTNGTTLTNAVWAYNPKTNTWSGKAAVPTARVAAAAAVENNIIYVIGGEDVNFNSLATVESYNPATNTWKEEASLLVAKSFHSAGLLGSTIVAAGGQTSPGVLTGDNEGYNASTNSWKSLTADPTARGRACAGSINGQLYVAGGYSGGAAGTPALSLTELFAPSKNTWTTLASMPQGSQQPGSAVYGGQLYCFGGEEAQAGTVLNKVQIYQP